LKVFSTNGKHFLNIWTFEHLDCKYYPIYLVFSNKKPIFVAKSSSNETDKRRIQRETGFAVCTRDKGWIPVSSGGLSVWQSRLQSRSHQASGSYVLRRGEGDSMIGLGIDEGDIAVIDRIIEPEHGDIVVAYIHRFLFLIVLIVLNSAKIAN